MTTRTHRLPFVVAVLLLLVHFAYASWANLESLRWSRNLDENWEPSIRGRALYAIDRGSYFAGIAALHLGNTRDAIAFLEPYATTHPNDRPAGLFLGFAYRAQGFESRALDVWRRAHAAPYFVNRGGASNRAEDIQTALVLGARNAATYYLLGDLLKNSGRTDASIRAFREGLAVDPKPSARRYVIIGTILENEGHFREAASSYQQAIHSDPDAVDAYLALGKVNRNDLNDDAAALTVLSQCSMRTRSLSCQMDGYATAMALRKVTVAERFAVTAMTQHPSSPFPRVAMGELAEIRHDSPHARAFYMDAIERGPNWYVPWFRVGRLTLETTGSAAQAVHYLRHAARLEPNNREVSQTLANALRTGAER